MFEGGAVHDGEASLANHLGARPVHVAALVVAAKEVVVGRHLDIGRREHHSKVWIGRTGDWFLYLNLFGCRTGKAKLIRTKFSSHNKGAPSTGIHSTG